MQGDSVGLPVAPTLGETVAGKYRLLRLIGSGGMGLVFEAVHLRLRQNVAIKFLRPNVLAMPEALERFEREARASARMRGPHIVRVLDVDADAKGRPYMVMELLRGRDLEAELHARGCLPIPLAVDWLLQACAAIGEAHAQGVVHRDLKPSNLFLMDDQGASIVKVLDFGISKVALESEASVTSTASTVGTPLYMSPEQVRASRDLDLRTDIWSLGVILYELVAGNPPFFGTSTAAIAAIVADATPSLRAARPDVPEALERAVMAALAKSPSDRFPTAEAFGAALMPFASLEGLTGPFSLRPSPSAYVLANEAMGRPHGAGCPTDRLSPRPGLPSHRHEPARDAGLVGDALRTFAGSLAIGVGIATSATFAYSTDTPGRQPAAATSASTASGHVAPWATMAARPRATAAVPNATIPGDLPSEPAGVTRSPETARPAPEVPRRTDRRRYL